MMETLQNPLDGLICVLSLLIPALLDKDLKKSWKISLLKLTQYNFLLYNDTREKVRPSPVSRIQPFGALNMWNVNVIYLVVV